MRTPHVLSLSAGPVLACALLLPTPAGAAPDTYLGYDQGLGESQRLASHPQADLARNAFMARLAAGVAAQTFESVATTTPVLVNRTLTLTFAAQTAVLQGSGLVFDLPAPSTVNPVNGIPSGVYPTSGTRGWLSADDFTLTFDAPQVALGFYGIDIGDFNGRLTLGLVHADNSITQVQASSGVVDQGGSVQFFGVLSVDRPFTAVRFSNSAPVGYDGFVFDDLVVANASHLAPVPEPAAWVMVAGGLLLLGGHRSARRRCASAARVRSTVSHWGASCPRARAVSTGRRAAGNA